MFEECYTRSADGTRIAYLRSGQGKPLVIVHGGFTIADEWFATAEILARDRAVVVIERRGRGRSGDADVHGLSVEVADVAAVIADVGGEIDLFGHSYGGALALAYALDHGFAGPLVLYEPAASMVSPLSGGLLPAIRDKLAAGDADAALLMAHQTLTRTPEPDIQAFQQSPLWAHHRALLPALLREVEALDGFRPTESDAERLQAEVTILLGTVTQQLVRDNAAGLVRVLPGLTVLPIEGQGHVCHLLDPRLMAASITRALTLPG